MSINFPITSLNLQEVTLLLLKEDLIISSLPLLRIEERICGVESAKAVAAPRAEGLL